MNGVCLSGCRCHIGAIPVGDKKPALGTEAEMRARLRAMTDAINKLRKDFQDSLHDQKPRPDRTTASDKPKRGKKR
jgi:hypothetical protein